MKPQTANYYVDVVPNAYIIPVTFKNEDTFLKFYSLIVEYLDINSDECINDLLGNNKKPEVYPNTTRFTLSKLCKPSEIVNYLRVEMDKS